MNKIAQAPPSRRALARAFSQLIPNVIRGAQLDFFAKRNITQSQFMVLISTRSYGRCAMSVLARNLHVSLPTMTGLVDRLVKAGYLKRSDHPEDRRQVVVELTTKGQVVVGGFQEMLCYRWEEVLKGLSPEETIHMHNAITKLQRQFDQENRL